MSQCRNVESEKVVPSRNSYLIFIRLIRIIVKNEISPQISGKGIPLMTTLKTGTMRLPGTRLGSPTPLPAMFAEKPLTLATRLNEDDGLFIGYGNTRTALPHSMQNEYGNELVELEVDTVTLENACLKAVFLPGYGGRMWSLFDKAAGRPLVHENPILKIQNFAVRNAWMAGGVEWNFGQRGHDVYTCSPVFAARLQADDGTPVLRLYEFNRLRAVFYQLDFYLPEDSSFLYVRVRLMNDRDETTPFYYWSNIACRETAPMRIVTPAATNFANTYVGENQHALTNQPLPESGLGFDVTYPTRHPIPRDHFFNIAPADRRFEAAIYEDGYGLIHTSTDRLRGRKLFVWGQSVGGHHWQRRLTAPDAPDYLEIQGGIAQTQMECLPLPPNTAWEWLEAYGALQADPDRIFGEWSTAGREVGKKLAAKLPRRQLDALLAATRDTIARKPAHEILFRGSGWGALEHAVMRKPETLRLSRHLDFGPLGERQAPWAEFHRTGRLPQIPVAAGNYQVQSEWRNKLAAAVRDAEAANPAAWLHYGIGCYEAGDYERAETAFRRALELEETPQAHYALANVARITRRPELAILHFGKALAGLPDDGTLAREALRAMAENQAFDMLAATYEGLPEAIRALPMCRLHYAAALTARNEPAAAMAILMENGGLEVPDIREGEVSLSDLYLRIQHVRAKQENRQPTPEELTIPASLDFRMS